MIHCPVCGYANDSDHIDDEGWCWCWNCHHEWDVPAREPSRPKPTPIKFEIDWGVILAFFIGYLVVGCAT